MLALFACCSAQVEPSLKCEAEPYRMSVFASSYYERSARYKCTFDRVKSTEDLAKAQRTSSLLAGNRVTTIIFINSNLSQLPDKMFAQFPYVKTFDASRLVLNEISTTTFFGVNGFDSIDFSNNNLKTLKDRTFATMQIKNLDLSMNQIETIEDKAFITADVEKLNLSFNKLKSIKFLNSFTYFNLVEMNDNQLESFDAIEVKKDGWSARRTIFEDEVYPKIFLQKNKLKTFDCTSSIKISSVTLDDNPTLNELSLNDCALETIDVSNCGSLEKVTLNDNLLSFTAKNVELNRVDLNGGKSITTLSLANASLTQASFDQIMTMENLTFLDLSYINIGILNISTFSKLKSLQFLYLKATQISGIQFGTFSHQHSVKIFDISDNNLGDFDMNMIFSMNSLLSLDLSGNNLKTLENVEAAHFTFTLLQKIDLSKNEWTCNYLLKLIKIFRIYKVALTRSNLEESGTNIHGIGCIHTEGEDDVIELLSDTGANITDVREKMNEMITEVTKNSQFRASVEARLRLLENNKVIAASVSALKSEAAASKIEVKNSVLLELTLWVLCICFTVFIAMKVYVFAKYNFLAQKQPMRSASERHLSMTVDDF